METNALPPYDQSDKPTGCCARFKDEGWDGTDLHFKDKKFLKAKTVSLFHIPLNMGQMFGKTFAAIEAADARKDDDFIVLSHDPTPWRGEHLFAVSKDVPGHEMVTLSGDYETKVFEGPFKDAPKWEREMESYLAGKGKRLKKTYFYYTTCPKCAKTYGRNPVVLVAETEAGTHKAA